MRKSCVSRVRKSCVISKKSLIPRTPTVKKLEIAYFQACNKRYDLKCCDPSWVINGMTVRCCAVDIRRHFSIHTQSSYCLSEPTCGEFNRCNDSRRLFFTPPPLAACGNARRPRHLLPVRSGLRSLVSRRVFVNNCLPIPLKLTQLLSHQ